MGETYDARRELPGEIHLPLSGPQAALTVALGLGGDYLLCPAIGVGLPAPQLDAVAGHLGRWFLVTRIVRQDLRGRDAG